MYHTDYRMQQQNQNQHRVPVVTRCSSTEGTKLLRVLLKQEKRKASVALHARFKYLTTIANVHGTTNSQIVSLLDAHKISVVRPIHVALLYFTYPQKNGKPTCYRTEMVHSDLYTKPVCYLRDMHRSVVNVHCAYREHLLRAA